MTVSVGVPYLQQLREVASIIKRIIIDSNMQIRRPWERSPQIPEQNVAFCPAVVLGCKCTIVIKAKS